MYDSIKELKSRRRRVGGSCRRRGSSLEEVGVAGVESEVWQVVGRGMPRLSGDVDASCGAKTHADACHSVCGCCKASQSIAMSGGNSRLRCSEDECYSNEEHEGETRTFWDKVREREVASSRVSNPATIFDDMMATPVLSAVLAARVDGGVGGLCGSKSSSVLYPRRRTSSRRCILKRLREAFTIGVCFLSIFRLPTWTLAVPIPRSAPSVTMSEDRQSSKPKWIDACGFDGSDGRSDGRHSPLLDPEGEGSEHLTDQQLISHILIVAKTAQMTAEKWREEYVNQTFNLDFDQHHQAWRGIRYQWLPTDKEIPKNLTEETSKEHLEQLTIIEALKNTFTYMQKYACGLEQVTWDLEDKHSPFSKNFTEAELELRNIICEIETALYEKGEKPPDNVQRNVMPDEFRSQDHVTHRNIRDWLIFRDYMNGVEYVIQVFEYFKEKLKA